MDSPVIDIFMKTRGPKDIFEESVFAPFGRFFDDDLFMLIYTNPGKLPANLRVLRNKLQVVSDRKIKKRSREKAALHLGREVVKRAETRDALVSTDFSCAIKWFELAIQLNSVEAAADMALLYLSKAKLELISDSDISLPEFKRLNSDGMSFDECCERQNEPGIGCTLTLRHVQSNFWGWNRSTFLAAFTCILAFLISTPRRAEAIVSGPNAEKRLNEVKWIRPLWSRLVKAAAPLQHDQEEYTRKKFEQLEAALLILDSQRGYDSGREASAKLVHYAPTVGVLEAVVIQGEIPRSPERSETAFLKQYEMLRSPIPLLPMPSLDRLHAIQAILSAEFPWAEDAVSAVLSELFARKRHGAAILGMSPLLLVGLPGGGKTRFCRRVSDLLGTPNTVINMAGMTDVKVLKRVHAAGRAIELRGSRVHVADKDGNPFFTFDEVDKTVSTGSRVNLRRLCWISYSLAKRRATATSTL